MFKEYDVVKIVHLFHSDNHYDGWQINKRPPQIGDTGTIVDIQNMPGLPTKGL